MSGRLEARLTAQLLAGEPAPDARSAVGRILAVQAQDPRGFRLAVRARTAGTTASDVDRALAERHLVVAWLNRGTLHLVRAEDHAWLHALTTPQLAVANRRRLQLAGVDEVDRAVDVVVQRLAEGPATVEDLRPLLAGPGLVGTAQGLVHVLFETSLRHGLLRGPMRGNEHASVLAADWLGPAPVLDREEALARLARRYLAGHGPAADRDLAVWANLPLRDVRAGLAAIATETATRDGLVDLLDRAEPAPLPPPRLLGTFDPLLHGWASRDAVLGEHAGEVVTANAIFRSIALVDGRAAGLWSIDRGRVGIRPFARLPAATLQALEHDAHDVLRYLGLPDADPVGAW